MPELDSISSYIDKNGILRDTNYFLAQLGKIESKAEDMAKLLKSFELKISDNNSSIKDIADGIEKVRTTTKGYTQETATLNLQKSEEAKLLKLTAQLQGAESGSIEEATLKIKLYQLEKSLLIKTTGQGSEKERELTDEIRKQKDFIAQASIEQKKATDLRIAEIKIMATEEGSIARAIAIRDRLRLIQKDINVETESGAQKSAAYIKKIDELSKFIEKNSDAAERQRLNIGKYSSAFDNLGTVGSKALSSINNKFTQLTQNILAAAGTYLGIQGLFHFGESAIEDFEKVEQQSIRTENALKNLGASAKDIKSLDNTIESLANQFTYLKKNDLVSVEQTLVQNGKLTAKQINDLLPVIVNFAANARIGINDAADAIVTSLEGRTAPALKKMGINLKGVGDESQKVAILTEQLGVKVANSAQIFQDSSEGKAAKYKNQLFELKTQIGEQLLPVYDSFLKGSIGVLKVLKELDFGNVVKGIIAMFTAWIAYRIYVQAAAIATAINNGETIKSILLNKESNLVTKAAIIIQQLFAAATRLLTFEITLFNRTIAVSPLGLFLTVLGAAVTIFGLLSGGAAKAASSFNKFAEEAKVTKEVFEKSNESFGRQKQAIDELVKSATNHNLSLDTRKKAIQELIALDPKHLEGLTLANIEMDKGKKIIDDYVEALHKRAIEEAAQDVGKEDQAKKIQAQLKLEQENQNFQKDIDENRKAYDKAKAENPNAVRQNVGIDQIELEVKTRHYRIVAELNQTITDVNGRQTILENIIKKNVSDATFNQKSGLGSFDPGAPAQKKDTKAELFKQLEDQRKAEYEAQKATIEGNRDADKAIYDDDRKSYQERLNAAQGYLNASIDLIDLKKKYESSDVGFKSDEDKRKAKLEIKNETDLTNTLVAIDNNSSSQRKKITADYNTEITKSLIDNQKQLIDLKKKHDEDDQRHLKALYEEQLKDTENAFAEANLELDQQYILDQKRYKGNKERLLLLETEYNESKKRLQIQAQIEALKIEISYTQEVVNLANIRAKASGREDDIDAAKKAGEELDGLRIKLGQLIADFKKQNYIDKAIQSLKDKLKELRESLFQTALSGLKDVAGNIFQSRIDDIDSLISKNDELKQATIDRINQETISEADKQAKIDQITKATAASDAALLAKKKQVQIRQAEFEKASALFTIGVDLALSIGKIKLAAAAAPLPLKPFILAQIPFAFAAALVQAAIVASKPIPKFKHGLNRDYEGLGIVGDAGKREVIIRKGGKMELTPANDTMTYIEKGDRIEPDAQRFLQDGAHKNIIVDSKRTATEVSGHGHGNGNKKIEQLLKEQNRYLDVISKKKELDLGASEKGMQALWKHISNQIKYINEQSNWG